MKYGRYLLLSITSFAIFSISCFIVNYNDFSMHTQPRTQAQLQIVEESLYSVNCNDYLEECIMNETIIPKECNGYKYSDNSNDLPIKLYSIDNKLCKILFPSRINFISHHKTGVMLSQALLREIRKFCKIQYNNSFVHVRNYHLWLRYLHFNNKTNNKYKLFHFIRDPVITIVSGFNYHATRIEK
eukprot:216574_1